VDHWFRKYELFHGPVRVGAIRGQGGACGFPTFWVGLIEYDPNLWAATDADSAHIAEYLTLARESARLLDAGQSTAEVNERMRMRYMDVVESGEWRLTDSRGVAIPIHCIMQHQNDLVSWVRVDGKEWAPPDAEPDCCSESQ
jgi:hypothetical protein